MTIHNTMLTMMSQGNNFNSCHINKKKLEDGLLCLSADVDAFITSTACCDLDL